VLSKVPGSIKENAHHARNVLQASQEKKI